MPTHCQPLTLAPGLPETGAARALEIAPRACLGVARALGSPLGRALVPLQRSGISLGHFLAPTAAFQSAIRRPMLGAMEFCCTTLWWPNLVHGPAQAHISISAPPARGRSPPGAVWLGCRPLSLTRVRAPPLLWIVVVVWVGWAGRAVDCMAAFLREASKAWENKENIRKASEKQALPHPRNLRTYHGPWGGGADAGRRRCIYVRT